MTSIDPGSPRPVATPDVERRPFAFDPERPQDRWRVALGQRLLVDGCLRAGSHLPGWASDRMGNALSRAWAHSVARAVDMTIDASGIEHIDPASQYLVAPLHESFVDVPVLLHLPVDLRFTVREELFDHDRIGSLLRATGQIAVPEQPGVSSLRTLMNHAADSVASGESLVVFPQGSVLGVEAAFSDGLVVLSRRLGLPILPIVLTGTHRVWGHPFDNVVRLHQTVRMDVLDPVPSESVDASSFRRLEQRMKERALGSHRSPVRRFDPLRDGWWDGYEYEIDPDFTELAAAVAAHRLHR